MAPAAKGHAVKRYRKSKDFFPFESVEQAEAQKSGWLDFSPPFEPSMMAKEMAMGSWGKDPWTFPRWMVAPVAALAAILMAVAAAFGISKAIGGEPAWLILGLPAACLLLSIVYLFWRDYVRKPAGKRD